MLDLKLLHSLCFFVEFTVYQLGFLGDRIRRLLRVYQNRVI